MDPRIRLEMRKDPEEVLKAMVGLIPRETILVELFRGVDQWAIADILRGWNPGHHALLLAMTPVKGEREIGWSSFENDYPTEGGTVTTIKFLTENVPEVVRAERNASGPLDRP